MGKDTMGTSPTRKYEAVAPNTNRFGLYLSDLNRDRNDSHGIINYAVGLANALPGALQPGEHLVIYANPAIARELVIAPSDAVTVRITPAPTPLRRIMSDHVLGVRRADRDGVCLLHFPKGFVPANPPDSPRIVATLHDDIPLLYARGDFGKEHVTTKSRYFTASLRHTLRRAHGLLTVSNTSLDRFEDLAREASIAMPPIFVSHQGITLPAGEPVPVEDKLPLVLHIGSTKPHKRSHEAVEFMIAYAAQSDSPLRPTILGPLNRRTELLLQSHPVNRIKRTMSIPELARLMRSSRALVFNSEREGFGLPPVESFALGTPAVFARTDVMEEVLGSSPGGYVQGDYESFAAAMDAVLALTSDDLLSLRAAVLDRYNWDAVAAQTLQAYRKVAAAA
ncbi:MAG: glycosyltransferase [Acidimicrobiia bacterium]|nr:glycosyltransferase [Acidimicrobiia bacterium]